MTTDPQSQPALVKDEAASCEQCGKYGALAVNDHWLCEDCLAVCGSCCPEFEGHDN